MRREFVSFEVETVQKFFFLRVHSSGCFSNFHQNQRQSISADKLQPVIHTCLQTAGPNTEENKNSSCLQLGVDYRLEFVCRKRLSMIHMKTGDL